MFWWAASSSCSLCQLVSSHDGEQSKQALILTRALIDFIAPPSRPHLILITSQRPHLLIPSHWGTVFQCGCVCSVISDSLWPYGLLCSWDSLGKNTGVGCHAILQGIFPTQGLNLSVSSALAGRFFTTVPPGKPFKEVCCGAEGGHIQSVTVIYNTDKKCISPIFQNACSYSKWSV